jgi:hypothetical protein
MGDPVCNLKESNNFASSSAARWSLDSFYFDKGISCVILNIELAISIAFSRDNVVLAQFKSRCHAFLPIPIHLTLRS